MVSYDPTWPARYREEAGLLTAALGSQAVTLEHVGSTAVTGLPAKPVIDILAGIRSDSPSDACLASLYELGYRPRRRDGPGRLYLRKGTPRSHFLHVVRCEGPDWCRFLAVRDLLRADPELAGRYAALKLELATGDRGTYAKIKSRFIEAMLRERGLTTAM